MAKIKDINLALDVFQNAAMHHAIATEDGDYKTANKEYKEIIKAISFLKEQNSLDRLLPLLNNISIGVKLWAAVYLLSKYEEKGLKVLEEISKTGGIHSLTAETTINEWKKGNLKL